MIWLLTTLAALAAAFYIAAPFYREASLRAPAGAPLRARQRELESQREGLLRELKELEFDRRMGKVDAEQYASARARATREASQVLRQLESLHAPPKPRPPKLAARPERSRLDLEIELEVAVARTRRRLALDATWACSCGRMMSANDGFCASCGGARPTAVALVVSEAAV